MTLEQFVGLYLALGTALYRDSVPAEREIEPILDRGKKAIAELKKDHRIFSTLPEDQAYFLQEQSGWVAVVDRARRVRPVHPANLALVRQHRERLAVGMPAEFLRNPFLEFTTILDERGVAFPGTARRRARRPHRLVARPGAGRRLPRPIKMLRNGNEW